MVLLAIGVAGREAPEIMALVDDISNEGLVVDHQDPTPHLYLRSASRQEKLQAIVAESIATVNLKQCSCPIPPLFFPTEAGKGLLSWLSTQKK